LDRLTFERFGYRMRLYPAAVCRATWSNPDLLWDEQRFFARYLRAGDVVVDAGANVGDTAMFAAKRVGPTGSVHAIEAHPRTFSFLREHVAMNGLSNITVYNVALGASRGEVHFSDLRTDDGNHVAADGICVVQRRLDDLLVQVEEVALLKIDVEGYEKFVLQGAPRVLARTSCVLFESWESHCQKFGYPGRDVLDLLHGAGFTILRESAGAWVPIASNHRSEHCQNLVAVRDVGRFRTRYLE
jgi:FkbM family methyltransferase